MSANLNKIKKTGSKSTKRKKRRQRLRQENKTAEKLRKHGMIGCRTSDIWYKTYQKMVKWHSEHQMNYWRMRAEQLQIENDQLRRSQRNDTKPESSSDDEDCSDSDFEPLDEEYLNFMEITQKHREELRRTREMEKIANENIEKEVKPIDTPSIETLPSN